MIAPSTPTTFPIFVEIGALLPYTGYRPNVRHNSDLGIPVERKVFAVWLDLGKLDRHWLAPGCRMIYFCSWILDHMSCCMVTTMTTTSTDHALDIHTQSAHSQP